MADTKTIQTRIVLRNDTQENWNTSENRLKKGEMAISYVGDGKAEIRFGETDGAQPYGNAVKLQISADQVLGLTKELNSISVSNYGFNTSLDPQTATAAEISAEISAKIFAENGKTVDKYNVGDSVVLREQIADTGKYQHAAYVWNGTAWEAMDGTYNADSVYFKENYDFVGDYERVGNITKGDTYETKGKSVSEVMGKIFTKELSVTTKPVPSVTITATNNSYEVGSSVKPTFTLTFDPKTYTYGSNTNPKDGSTTGVTASKYKITYNRQGTTTTLTGDWTTSVEDTAITVTNGTNTQSVALTADFTLPAEGTYVPTTNLGNEDLDKRVTTTSNTATATGKITGYYKWFYTYKNNAGVVAGLTKPSITQADITALNADSKSLDSTNIRKWSSTTSNTCPGSITTSGMQQIFIAAPKATVGSKKIKILNKADNSPAGTVQGPFDVTVKDAGGTAVAYSLFVVDNTNPEAASPSQIYNITCA